MRYDKIKLLPLCLVAVMIALTAAFTSCGDDDDNGEPVISGVKILSHDTINVNRDQYYTEAAAGTTIMIEGERFHGLTKLLMNNVEVAVNPNYAQDTYIICTIPEAAAASQLNLIELQTSHGLTQFPFKVTGKASVQTTVPDKGNETHPSAPRH